MLNLKTKLFLALIVACISSGAIAGTILLLGVGLGTPASGPPPMCSNSLDFSDQCNSQYVGTF
jgi:hypothetical protein